MSENNHGGVREGSGRKPIEKKLSNYNIAISLLDSDIEKNIEFLIQTRNDGEAPLRDRIKCAEIILKKILPDRSEVDNTHNLPEDFNIEWKIVKNNGTATYNN